MGICAYSIDNSEEAGILRAFASPSIEYLHLRMSTGGAVVAFPLRPLLENMSHTHKSRIFLVLQQPQFIDIYVPSML